MAGYRRAQSMRRLQDQYAKLPPEKQRAMGYGTITKASPANAAPAPATKAKPKPVKVEVIMEQYDKLPGGKQRNMGPRTKEIAGHPDRSSLSLADLRQIQNRQEAEREEQVRRR